MFRSLTAVVLACLLLAPQLAPQLDAQVRRPTAASQPRPGNIRAIESLTVTEGIISLIASNGGVVALPDGTFEGPGGSSIIVVTGQIREFTPPAGSAGASLPLRPLEIEGAAVQTGALLLIGAQGQRHNLPDGTFMSSAGSKIVIQNRTISEIGGD